MKAEVIENRITKEIDEGRRPNAQGLRLCKVVLIAHVGTEEDIDETVDHYDRCLCQDYRRRDG